MLPEIKTITCPNCASRNIKKSGIRKNMLQQFQKYWCKDCTKTFRLGEVTGKKFKLRTILNATTLYNLGNSQTEVASIIRKKFHAKPTQKTISNWISEYSENCTFAKLRKESVKQFKPNRIIESHEFLHNSLPYKFQIHKAKMDLLFRDKRYNNQYSDTSRFEKPLKEYFSKILTKKFPHHIFSPKEEKGKLERSSQVQFTTLPFVRRDKNNLANKLCGLALNIARNNRERHSAVQDFMLANDSVTVAAEVPVYLINDDIYYFKSRGFKMPFPQNQQTPITGHIDVVQIRNGRIHILDYKPDAVKVNAVNQLTVYALALASRTRLMVRDFKCAWFDEENYYEFSPLQTVYEKRKK